MQFFVFCVLRLLFTNFVTCVAYIFEDMSAITQIRISKPFLSLD